MGPVGHISNVDDYMRNHAFHCAGSTGWRPSPAYDRDGMRNLRGDFWVRHCNWAPLLLRREAALGCSDPVCYKTSDNMEYCARKCNGHMPPETQRERLIPLLQDRKMARASELRAAGVAESTISRAVDHGDVIRVGRGLYQLPDSEMDVAVTLAEPSKRVPKGTICMISALAYHGLTDQMSRKVWIAIGAKDWAPSVAYPPLRIVRFRSPYPEYGIEHHVTSGVDVPIHSIAKSLADAFRKPRLLDRSVTIDCLRNVVTKGKTTPGAIAAAARDCGARNTIRPNLERIVSNG